MPLQMREIERQGQIIGFRAVDTAGKVSASFVVGRMTGGKMVRSVRDARIRAMKFVQAVNLAKRRKRGN